MMINPIAGNEVTYSGDEFYISYREERSGIARVLDDFCHEFGNRPKPKDLPETALCVRTGAEEKSVCFLILYGDHRENYRQLAPNLKACLDYFNNHINEIAHSSDTPEEITQ